MYHEGLFISPLVIVIVVTVSLIVAMDLKQSKLKLVAFEKAV